MGYLAEFTVSAKVNSRKQTVNLVPKSLIQAMKDWICLVLEDKYPRMEFVSV